MTANPSFIEKYVNIDYNSVEKKITAFIAEAVINSNLNGLVIGLSGGIDSSVVLELACNTLPRHNILGLITPYDGITPQNDIDDALEMAKDKGIDYRVITINSIHDSFMKNLADDKIASGNLNARIRMSLLYYHANLMNRLVIGTGDKSEIKLGYYTKYGDGGIDLLPIGDLYKLQIRKLATHMKIKSEIINKKSSPQLWKDHSAESEIGISYELIDSILVCIEESIDTKEICNILNIEKKLVDKIILMIDNSNHKKILPKICEI